MVHYVYWTVEKGHSTLYNRHWTRLFKVTTSGISECNCFEGLKLLTELTIITKITKTTKFTKLEEFTELTELSRTKCQIANIKAILV